jgi:hypothetical protein
VLGEIFLLAKEYEIAKEYLERSLSMKKAK